MTKIWILLFVAFIASSNAWSMNPRWNEWLDFHTWEKAASNKSLPLQEPECVFFRRENVLGCVGLERVVVDCKAELNMTDLDQSMFSSFIVGVDSRESLNNVSRFSLYPSLTEYPHHLASKMALRGIPIEFLLHKEINLPVFGVRVIDSYCYDIFLNYVNLIKFKDINIVTLSSFEIEKPQAIKITMLYVV